MCARPHPLRLAALLLLAGLLAAPVPAAEQQAPPIAAGGHWAVPPEGVCTPEPGLLVAAGDDAAAPFPFAPGDTLSLAQIETLQRFLPRPLWEYRERFFYEGMRLEVGPCHRDYAPPAFSQEVTARESAKATLAGDGGLEGWTAGLGFPPAGIDRDEDLVAVPPPDKELKHLVSSTNLTKGR
jgi:hypothetical protein